MKLAFTGSSSTGKSSCAKSLLDNPQSQRFFSHICRVDARQLLAIMGVRNIDEMDNFSLRHFELLYILTKSVSETAYTDYITERSYVDVAAYWIERDSAHCNSVETDVVLQYCKRSSEVYDLHAYLPFSPDLFVSDGWRSTDISFHERVDRRIDLLLHEWNLNFVQISVKPIEARVAELVRACEER